MQNPREPDSALAYQRCLYRGLRSGLMDRRHHSPAVAATMLAANVTAEVLEWLLAQPAETRWRRALEMHRHLTGLDPDDTEARP